MGDRLVGTRVIAVGVLAASSVVLDVDPLNVHSVRCFADIDWSTSPLTGSVGSSGSWFVIRSVRTADPGSHLDLHGSLGVVLATESESITVGKRADTVAIDQPLN